MESNWSIIKKIFTFMMKLSFQIYYQIILRCQLSMSLQMIYHISRFWVETLSTTFRRLLIATRYLHKIRLNREPCPFKIYA